MTSLIYKFPKLYHAILRLIYGKDFDKRYKEIAKLVDRGQRVLDLGCGTGELEKHLVKSCIYEGWDLNERFINSCRKKGLNVQLRSVFDYQKYPETDVIVISDLLHHIIPRHEELIKEARKRAEKLIIMEPFITINRDKRIIKWLSRLWDCTLGDDDGINSFNQRSKWFKTKKEVHDFFMSFKPKIIKEIAPEYLVEL